jgi:predicted amidohydrolase YtcJ
MVIPMNKIRLVSIFLILFMAGCSQQPDSISADVIFVGDNIITMEDDAGVVTGVAILGDEIIDVGESASVMRLRGPETRVVELGDRALLPGFVDSHGHFSFTARLIDFENLSSPPVGRVDNIGDIVELLTARIAKDEMPAGEWLVGYGYDDSLLAENRHPTRDDLDAVSTEHPIIIMHVSGHLSVANSLALRQSEITADTEDPPGGVIRRRDGSREPNGVLEESASSGLLIARIGAISDERFKVLTREAAKVYASYGITTAQDGAVTPTDFALMKEIAAAEPYAIDIGTYPVVTALSDEAYENFVPETEYEGGVRLVGIKFGLDGSPQGRTAWLTEPYTEGPPGAADDYVAYATIERDYYIERVAELMARKIPLLVHANGDAAMDLMMDGVSKALQKTPNPDHRAVIIHAQLMREDQVQRAAELGVVPSYFSAHTFFWGDWHRKSFGEERAQNISPTRWATDYGLNFTIHNDAPVVPPNMMRLLSATVNRQTRSGHVIGPHQRLTVEEALHAITLGGAFQFFEEDRKGSLLVGKQADLVILDENPLSVAPEALDELQIMETFSRGRSVYRSED